MPGDPGAASAQAGLDRQADEDHDDRAEAGEPEQEREVACRDGHGERDRDTAEQPTGEDRGGGRGGAPAAAHGDGSCGTKR